MKLKNFNKTMNSTAFNNSLKEKFGYRVNLEGLSLDKAQKMLLGLTESIENGKKIHGERFKNSKSYVEKTLVKETLSAFVSEKKSKLMLEARKRQLKKKLIESEALEAEVYLAAKDIVDRLQKVIEDLGQMQNEELQPLVDSIRQTMGDETASSFERIMSDAISDGLDTMREVRSSADSASRVLSGDMPDDVDPSMGNNDEEEIPDMSDDEEEISDIEFPEPDMSDEKKPSQKTAGRGKRNIELNLD